MMEERSGWVTFAGVLLLIAGVLNIIYGIAAIGDSRFFVADQKYILSNLHTWGWVTLVLGALQFFAAFSLWSGGLYGRIVGITAAGLSAIAALLSIPAYPLLVAGDLRAGHRDHPPDRDARDRGEARLMLLATLIGFVLLLVWILVLVDVVRRHDLSKGAKSAWIIITLVVPLIGPIVYIVLRPAATSMAEREAAIAAASDPPARPSDEAHGRGGPA